MKFLKDFQLQSFIECKNWNWICCLDYINWNTHKVLRRVILQSACLLFQKTANRLKISSMFWYHYVINIFKWTHDALSQVFHWVPTPKETLSGQVDTNLALFFKEPALTHRPWCTLSFFSFLPDRPRISFQLWYDK